MADLVKKLDKAGVGLHQGETIIAAMVLHPLGMAKRVAVGGAIEQERRRVDRLGPRHGGEDARRPARHRSHLRTVARLPPIRLLRQAEGGRPLRAQERHRPDRGRQGQDRRTGHPRVLRRDRPSLRDSHEQQKTSQRSSPNSPDRTARSRARAPTAGPRRRPGSADRGPLRSPPDRSRPWSRWGLVAARPRPTVRPT